MKLLSKLGIISHLDYSSDDFPSYHSLSDLPSPPIIKKRLLFKSNIGNVPSDKQKCQQKVQHEFTIKGIKIIAASKKDAIKKYNYLKKK